MAMKIIFYFIFIIQGFVGVVVWAGENLTCEKQQQTIFSEIEITGNAKTDRRVILGELGFRSGEKICESTIAAGIQRLKEIGLFTQVNFERTKEGQAGGPRLRITVIEKWTTIPIFKVNSGGGVSQYTLGVYDPNIYGRFLEAGVQYENLAGANSGVLWFKNPRLFDQRQGIDLQYWNTKRIRIKYDQSAKDAQVHRGFLHHREKLYLDYFREFSEVRTGRVSIEYNNDSFSTELISDEVLDKMRTDFALPPSSELVIGKIGLEFGRIIGESQSLDGRIFTLSSSYAHPLDRHTDPFYQGDISFRLYDRLSPRWQFAQRFLAGGTSTKVLQYWFYLGGLDRVRGFADNRFAGRYYGLSNSELRYLALERPAVLVQGATFVDLVAIGENESSLSKIKAASLGAGIRIILPKYYRFILRVDYARPVIKSDTMNLSFGVQQFF